MHSLNPFNSRSYNAKVTNWRVLQLRGLRAAVLHLFRRELAERIVREIDIEIEQTKKVYADYVKAQFGTNVDPVCALKSPNAMCENCMCWKQTRANCS